MATPYRLDDAQLQQSLARLGMNMQGQQPQAQRPKTQNRGGFLTSLISEAGGTGGAIGGAALGASLGSVVPGIGTILGGAAGGLIGGFGGGFGGRAAENKIRDDEFNLDTALNEGLMSGAFGAIGGAGQGFKAAKALKGVDKLDDAVRIAMGLDDVGKAGTRASMGEIKSAISASKGAGKAAGLNLVDAERAKAYGITQGTKVGGQQITPKTAQELLGFLDDGAGKYVQGGISAGTPQAQANSIQALHGNVSKALVGSLDEINRPLVNTEKNNLIKSIQQAITKDSNITGSAKSADKLIAQIKTAPDLKALEGIRQSADDLLYSNASGAAGSSAKASQGSVVRGAIDDFITPLSDNYKSIKGDYGKSRQLLELASKNVKSAKGAPIPFFGGSLRAPVTGGMARGAEMLSKGGGAVSGVASFGGGIAKPLVRGTAGRGIANQVMGNGQPQPEVDPVTGEPLTGENQTPGLMNGISGPLDQSTMQPVGQTGSLEDAMMGAEQSPYSKQNLLADMQRDPQNASKYIDYYQQLQDVFAPAAGSELTTGAINTVSEFDNSLANLDEVERLVQSQPDTFNPVMGRLRSLNPLDQTAANVNQATLIAAQNIGRALEGGKLTDADIARYQKALPGIADTPEVAQQKIDRLRFLISNQRNNYMGLQGQYGSGGGVAPSNNIQDAIMQAQQQTQGRFF